MSKQQTGVEIFDSAIAMWERKLDNPYVNRDDGYSAVEGMLTRVFDIPAEYAPLIAERALGELVVDHPLLNAVLDLR